MHRQIVYEQLWERKRLKEFVGDLIRPYDTLDLLILQWIERYEGQIKVNLKSSSITSICSRFYRLSAKYKFSLCN